jgi:AcrR family transcriptional regulator
MSGRQGPRPGGRSARVQASVHGAARELLGRLDRAEVTVPGIAAAAGVTPSTIYRRWGGLAELLADVAVERLRPESGPSDTGSAHGDLRLWAEQYADEMHSAPGREMMRDVLAAGDGHGACRCWDFTKGQIEAIAARAQARGEAFPSVETVMDRVVAPILSRLLFERPAAPDHIARLVDETIAARPIPCAPEPEAARPNAP